MITALILIDDSWFLPGKYNKSIDLALHNTIFKGQFIAYICGYFT